MKQVRAKLVNEELVSSTAIRSAGYLIEDGGYNTAVGYQASYSLASGDYNVAIGREAGRANKVGDYTVAIGSQALYRLVHLDQRHRY